MNSIKAVSLTIIAIMALSSALIVHDAVSADQGTEATTDADTSDVVTPSWYSQGQMMTISTAEELRQLATLVNGGTSFEGETVELGGNIDLVGTGDWVPIGTKASPFKGVFDGNGYTVSNLTITQTNVPNDDLYLGLFGAIAGKANTVYTSTSQVFDVDKGAYSGDAIAEEKYSAVVKNLRLSDVNITAGGSKVGALVGQADDAYIYNIHADSGSVIGTNSVGGIVGRGYGTVISGCTTGIGMEVGTYNDAADYIYNIGGIVGSMRESQTSTGVWSAIAGCTNMADVSAYLTAGGVGGIVGQVSGNDPMVVYDCDNYGDITITGNREFTRAIDGLASGIGGHFQGGDTNVIAFCSNHGSIRSNSTNTSGAVSGIANNYMGTIYQCENHGDITGNALSSAGFVAVGASVTVIGGVNTGDVSTTYDGGKTSTVCNGTTHTTYKEMTFATVGNLQEALVKDYRNPNDSTESLADLTLQKVTVTNAVGTIEMPQYLRSLVSERKVCTEVVVGGRSGESGNAFAAVGIPGATVTVASGTELVSSTGSPASLFIAADDMTLENSGEIQRLCLENISGLTIHNMGTITEVMSHGYVNTDTYMGCDGTVINNDSRAMIGSLTIWGDNSILYNEGSVTSIIIDGSDNTVLENEGSIGSIESRNVHSASGHSRVAGENLTVYNGTRAYGADETPATLNYIWVQGDGTTIYNYGTIDRGSTSGHTILIGTAGTAASSDGQTQEAPASNPISVTLHNYGSIYGSSMTGSNYIIYAPGAQKLDVYNHAGSVIQPKGITSNGALRYFLYFGYDGLGNTAAGQANTGVMNLYYAAGTVLDKDGNTVAPTLETSPIVFFVGNGDGDRTVNIQPLGDEDPAIHVTFRDGKVSEKVVVVDGAAVSIPSWTKDGFTLTGWTSGSDDWENSNITKDVEVNAVWELSLPEVSIEVSGADGAQTLTAVVAGSASGVTYAYSWTLPDGSTTDQQPVTIDGAGTYTVKVTASSDGYESKSAEASYTHTVREVTHVVNYIPNGGTGSMGVQEVPAGTDASLTRNGFTNPGFTFAGWNTAADGTGVGYADGATVNLSANLTLYAQWSVPTHVVAYDANGGSGTMSSQTVVSGSPVTVASNAFTYTGYRFTGWNTAANGSGTSYAPGATITVTSGITLYAQWEVDSTTEEEVTVNPDGSTTETVTETVTNPDGSTTVTETVTNTDADGNVTSTETVTTESDGVTTEKVTVSGTDSEGNSTGSKITETVSSGDVESGEGSMTQTVTEVDADGTTVGSTVTEVTATTTESDEGTTTVTETVVTDRDGEGNALGSVEQVVTQTVTEDTTSVTTTETVKDADGATTQVTDTVSSETQILGGTMTVESSETRDGDGNITSSSSSIVAEADEYKVSTMVVVEDDHLVHTVVTVGSADEVDEDILNVAIAQSDAVYHASDPSETRAIEVKGEDITAVTVPSASMQEIAKRDASFTVITHVGSMGLDSDVVTNLSGPGHDVTVTMKEADDSELTRAQIRAMGDGYGISLTADVGDSRYHHLGGSAHISVPFEITDGREYGVYYIDTYGAKTLLRSEYDGDAFTFSTTHFSVFVIDVVESGTSTDPDTPSTPGTDIPSTPSQPSHPSYDDDDEYVPPSGGTIIIQPSGTTSTTTSSSDDDEEMKVAIVACAAVGVLAALVAVFVWIDRKP